MTLRRRVVLGATGWAAALILWEFLRVTAFNASGLAPSTVEIAKVVGRLVSSAAFAQDLGSTLARTLVGLGLGAASGVPLGLLMAQSSVAYAVVVPVADFVRSVPVTTLYPIFVLTLGIDDRSKIAMIAVASTFVVALNTAYGAATGSKTRVAAARLAGFTRGQVFWRITTWQALPYSMIGVRIALGLSMIVAVLTELFMGANHGLGQRLTDAYTAFRIAETYALVIITGGVGVSLNIGLRLLERQVVHWSGT